MVVWRLLWAIREGSSEEEALTLEPKLREGAACSAVDDLTWAWQDWHGPRPSIHGALT